MSGKTKLDNEMTQKSVEERLRAAREKTDKNPTENEKMAGNYSMGHISINGFQISIENPKGSYRCGKDKDGKEWRQLMHNDYGYFTKTKGKDGDAIDVFIGDNFESERIFAVDQRIDGEFDETKVMFCFTTEEQAKKAYLSNYSSDWKGFWKITETDMYTFKKWLYDGHKQRKPFSDYVVFSEKNKLNESALDNTMEEKNIEEYFTEILSKIGTSSNLRLGEIYKDEYDTQIVEVYGGLNGHGEWKDYLEDLSNLFGLIADKYDAWVVDIDIDVLDDVFTLKIGIEMS